MERSTIGMWLTALAAVAVALAGAVVGHRLPACTQEDGGPYPCVWDGPNRGNHQGARIIVWSDD